LSPPASFEFLSFDQTTDTLSNETRHGDAEKAGTAPAAWADESAARRAEAEGPFRKASGCARGAGE
jgi:hypothetical protein